MTNYEHYKEQIERITRLGRMVAINATTGEIVCCGDINCNECLFQGSEDASCPQKAFEWADEEYKESEINWSKVPVDTPVLVSDDGKKWSRKHFSRVVNGIPYTWMYGSTSWTAHNNHNNEITHHYIKLGEVE